MNYAVIGSRKPSKKSITKLIKYLNSIIKPEDTIVTGGAFGADTVGMEYAIEHKLDLVVYCPNGWFNLELAAKARAMGKDVRYTSFSYTDRNTLIINNSDKVICPDYGNGSIDAIWKAVKQHKPVYTTGKYIPGKFIKTVPNNIIQVG